MKDFKQWIWFLFFGSLWGIFEVIFGEPFFRDKVPHASVFLSTWAFFVLALARGIRNIPGSSSIIGIFAALFKLVNVSPFFCHLLGIITLGLAFDFFSTLLLKPRRSLFPWATLTGILSSYGGYSLFALIITYLIRYEYWTSGGIEKVLQHIFVEGSFASFISLFIVPLGLWLGSREKVLEEYRSKWASVGAVMALVLFWTLGRVIG